MFAGVEDWYGGLDALIHTDWLPGPETATNNLAKIDAADWGRFTHAHMTMLLLTTRRAAASMRLNPTAGTILTVTGLGSSTSIGSRGAAWPATRSTVRSNRSP